MATERVKILLVNPSFGSRPEQHAWASLASSAEAGHCEVHVWAARPVEPPSDFHTTTRPARLEDYGAQAIDERFGASRVAPAPPWLSPERAALQTDWEQRRHADVPDALLSLRAVHLLANEAESVLTDLAPDLVITTNKLDHPCALFRLAAQHLGISAGLVERSPFAGLWFEPRGIFTESTIANRWAEHDASASHRAVGREVVSELLRSPATFRAREDYRGDRSDGPPHVLLPMDNVLWTGWAQAAHPQGKIDYPWLDGPQAAIDTVADVAASHGLSVRLRPHPSCREVDHWQLPANTTIDRTPLADAIEAAVGMAAFNTKVTFPAVAAGLPVITCAPNPLEPSGLTLTARSREELSDRIASLSEHHVDPADIEAYFGWMASEHMVAEAWLTENRPDEVLHQLRGLVDTAHDKEPRRATTPDTADLESPLTVLDVSRLQEGGSRRYSGIAEFQRQLIAALPDVSNRRVVGVMESVGAKAPDLELASVSELATALDGGLLVCPPGALHHADRSPTTALGPLDCYHSLHPALPPTQATGRAARVLTVHDVIHEFRPELDQRPSPEITAILDASLPHVDHIVCDSQQTLRDLHQTRRIDGPGTSVVQLGAIGPRVDEDCAPRWFDGRRYMLLVAQESSRKNVVSGIRAINRVVAAPDFSDVHVVLAGSRNSVDRAAQHLSPGAQRRTTRLVAPSTDDLRAAYRGCEVLVFPSLFEGFGLIPLDAMAQGAAVVAVWNSSIAEVCGSGVEYALGGDQRTLARAILRLLRNDEYRDELRQSARSRAGMLTWDRCARGYAETYERVTAAVRPALQSGAQP